MQDDDQSSTGGVVQCPESKRHKDDIIGCGSSNVTGADEEGFHDCLSCGLFFKAPYNAGGKPHERA